MHYIYILDTQHYAFLPAEHVRSMAESNGKHAARWYDDLEPRRHMIAERSNEKLNLERSQKRVSCMDMADRALSLLYNSNDRVYIYIYIY